MPEPSARSAGVFFFCATLGKEKVMGGGCREVPGRDVVFVGGHCENGCFRDHGGCEASAEFEAVKTKPTCEWKPWDLRKMTVPMHEVNAAVDEATARGGSIFLYVPDMFSDTYFEQCFARLPQRNGNTYIATNASVGTLHERANWKDVHAKGIRELWLGVESACPEIRKRYFKPAFTNAQVVEVTEAGEKAGVHVCWYLVDGCEDDERTRALTFALVKQGSPFRVHIGQLGDGAALPREKSLP